MMTQVHDTDPRPWRIHRNWRGWPCWYQRWLEAWWVVTGQWSLHRAWQEGTSYGRRMEYMRVVQNGGDLVPIMRKVVDVTFGYVHEDESVPSTEIADRLIAKAWQAQRAEADR